MDVSLDKFIDRCNIDTFLIIDEVQKIYKPKNKNESHHGEDIFWKTFKYIKQSTRLHIVVFTSYGHYGAYASHGNHAVMDISPTNDLKENNKWGFNDVCFTEEEYNDYFHQFCKVCLKKLENEHIQHLLNYLREITNLHPGLVTLIMNEIRGRFIKRETLTFEDVFMYLKSNDFNCHLKGIRATPKITDIVCKNESKDIAKSKGVGTDGRLLERVWQMEFYRSSMLVLPADVFASVDVGALYSSKDGNRLEEHKQRFGRYGVYAPIKKIAKAWAIIDIRNCRIELPEQAERGTNDIYVLWLAYPDGTEEGVRLLGEAENLLGYNISDFWDDPMEI
ncbi:hypothetical protein GLOIN_2v1485334 [Rhizophagus clarus]|uniref:Uncharacterized protein n=1 Tax=Rhizophagus clarus TaxID=94130 RepID=A0A8H3LS36_9GLOM|nr:hypothetical protein GLOIN_2v1485334 [Rhizophagus clarus]